MSRRTRLIVAALFVLLGLATINTLRLGVGANMTAQCSLGRYPRGLAPPGAEHPGYVSCDFVNGGYVPGRLCAAAHAGVYGSDLAKDSQVVCSGIMWPLTMRTEMVPDAAGAFCGPKECEVSTVRWP